MLTFNLNEKKIKSVTYTLTDTKDATLYFDGEGMLTGISTSDSTVGCCNSCKEEPNKDESVTEKKTNLIDIGKKINTLKETCPQVQKINTIISKDKELDKYAERHRDTIAKCTFDKPEVALSEDARFETERKYILKNDELKREKESVLKKLLKGEDVTTDVEYLKGVSEEANKLKGELDGYKELEEKESQSPQKISKPCALEETVGKDFKEELKVLKERNMCMIPLEELNELKSKVYTANEKEYKELDENK